MSGIEILAVGDQQQAEYDEQQANNNGTNSNLSTEPEESKAEAAPDTTETQEASKESVEQAEEGKQEVTEEESDEGFYFGDTRVDVEVPAEISDALKGAKIDETQLLKELFAKDGKFEVSEKTKAALDKAFGKSMVDGYLNLFRQQNQMAMDSYKKQEADTAAQVKANAEDFQTLVGGDEGWSELDAWASENLDDAQLSQFNAVMSLPVEHYQAQRAVVEALKIKRDAQIKAAEGDSQVTLPTDGLGESSRSNSGALPASLSRAEFQELMFSDRYKKEPQYAQQVDKIRSQTIERERASRR
ncbi:capsid and scaffold protein [Ralstonia phage Reminis]|uniref:Capsid and scaffold protein n=1 Tax=Ralstonia phage Reminis TaxID=2662139 RepID=A0A5Q2UAJ5_9CAUD|nr:capsid and scaffold protein [Ralstonia phage Reminis]